MSEIQSILIQCCLVIIVGCLSAQWLEVLGERHINKRYQQFKDEHDCDSLEEQENEAHRKAY